MFSTDKQMGYQCFVSFFDLRDPSQIGEQSRQGLLQGGKGSVAGQSWCHSVCLSVPFLPSCREQRALHENPLQ